MIPVTYRDLPKFGLPFLKPDDPLFGSVAQEIRELREYPVPQISGDLNTAAVLLNQSGKAIITLAWIWRYALAGQEPRTSRHFNLGSGTQMDVLAGRTRVAPDPVSFILPGSKRLITEAGMFGDNTDVLAREPRTRGVAGGGGRGAGWAFRGRGARSNGPEEQVTGIELQLDFVVFEDGLCVGPDEANLFENLTADLEQRRSAVDQIVRELRAGASPGRIFEILRPLARHGFHGRDHHPVVLTMFANGAIRYRGG